MKKATGTTGEQCSKGFTLKGALTFVEGSFGSDGVDTLLRASSEDLRRVLQGKILPSGWYPFRYQVELYETIDRVFGEGDLALCWEIGKFTSEYEMTRFHKLFLKMASLDLWIRSAGLMWGRYYDAGTLVLDRIDENEGVVRLEDFDPLSKAWCYDFGGWLLRTMELNGLDRVRVEHSHCRLDGSDNCVWTGRFEQRIRSA